MMNTSGVNRQAQTKDPAVRIVPGGEKVTFPRGIWIACAVLLGLVLALNYWVGQLAKNNKKNLANLNQAYSGFNKQSQGQLTQEVVDLKSEISYLSDIFDPRDKWIKKDYDLTIHFVEELGKINRAFKSKASEKGLQFTELEFKEKLPSETEAVFLLNQLNSIKEIVALGMEYGVSVKSITPGAVEELKDITGVKQIKTKLDLVCPPRFLVEFVIKLNSLIPRACLDSLLLKLKEPSFEVVINLKHIVVTPGDLGIVSTGKDAVKKEPPLAKIGEAAVEEAIHTLRSNNPFIMFEPPVKPDEPKTTTEPVIEEPKKQRFLYKGRGQLRGEEIAVVEDTVADETVFLNTGDKVGSFILKSFNQEKVVLQNMETKEDITVKIEEK